MTHRTRDRSVQIWAERHYYGGRRFLGAPLLFERLWQESGCRAVVEGLLAARRFEFAVERAVFLTVLHRLMVSGSDRACEHWRDDYHIDDIDGLDLHHLYRAMSWLGEKLPATEQAVRHARAALHQGPRRGAAVCAPARLVRNRFSAPTLMLARGMSQASR